MHTDSSFCGVLPANHYHVLFDVSDVATDFLKKTKLYSVPSMLIYNFQCVASVGNILLIILNFGNEIRQTSFWLFMF